MSKPLFSIGVPVSIALLAGAIEASADVCIPPKVVEALTSCPENGLPPAATKRTPISVRTLPPPPQKGSPRPSPPDSKLAAAQIRRGLASLKSTQLLITQIQGLESLLGQTMANSPDRPGLVRRLADSYVELETTSFRTKIENRIKASQSPGQAAKFEEEAKKAEKVESAARDAAIKRYTELKARHGGWCQNPSPQNPALASGCVDETLYNLAYEHEQAGKLDEARKTYFELIQSSPGSKYIPNAYLAFGELFFDEARGDPTKWALAEQSYRQVVKYPAPGNTVLAYAHYKLGYVYWSQGDAQQAVAAFKKTIEIGAQYPNLPNAAPLALSARRDILPVYALAGDAKKAHDFFAPLAGDSPKTYKMLADLGQGYLDIGRFKEAVDLYRDLQKRDRGPRTCEYQGHITFAVMALKSGDKSTIKPELDRQLEVEAAFAAGSEGEADKRACANTTASLVVETAMAFHLEAVGTPGVRGTLDAKTMAIAADLYEKAIARFTAADFERFEFPRIVKDDWPTPVKIKYALGDLLYTQRQWARAAAAYDAVVAEQPKGPLAGEAGFASAICYQNAYLAAHEGKSTRAGMGKPEAASLAAKPLGDVEKRMLSSFDRFLCSDKPAAGDREGKDRHVEVAYARARTYFEAHRWAEAAVAFRAIAMENADHDAGIPASQLYLESLNVMVNQGQQSCVDEMSGDVPKLFDLYCKGDKPRGDKAECGRLGKMKIEVLRAVIEKNLKGIHDSDPQAYKKYEEGASAYLKIWNDFGKAACEASEPGCERMDEILYNSAKAFSAAHLVAKAVAVRKILVDPRYHLEKTEVGRKSTYDIAANYQAMAVYDDAATWYEKYSRDNPSADKAAQALEDALVLRFGLGQDDQAIKDGDLFEKTYARKHPAIAAQVAFAMGEHFASHDDLPQAKRRLDAAMSTIDRTGTLDVQIQAHALLGRAIAKTVGPSAAAVEYGKVRSLFKDAATTSSRLAALEPDEARRQKRLARTLTAVGESVFFFAEQKRKEVDRIRFPEYKGSGRRDDVMAHIKGKVLTWMKKKQPAIEEAERAYVEVLKIEPSPPPQWVIASGSRVGHLWGRFVAEFRAAPTPAEWKQKGPSPFGDLTWEEIRATYEAEIDKHSEPYRQRAKIAYTRCLTDSVKYQHFDQSSRACEVWLSKNYPSEFHAVDELRDAPSRVGGTSFSPPALLSASER